MGGNDSDSENEDENEALAGRSDLTVDALKIKKVKAQTLWEGATHRPGFKPTFGVDRLSIGEVLPSSESPDCLT